MIRLASSRQQKFGPAATIFLLVVASIAASLPANGDSAVTFPLEVVNGTNGRWRNQDIWLTIVGQHGAGHWSYVTADGMIHLLDSSKANGAGHLARQGQNYAPLSFRLPASGKITMPSGILGGRIYISLGGPLYLAIAGDNSGLALPDANNPSDPNANTDWDFYEFTFVAGQVNYGGDTSQVDQFGFPIDVRVQQTSSGIDSETGFTVSRDQIFSHFLNSSDPDYRTLANAHRVLAPRTSTKFLASARSSAMQSYIDAVWRQYQQSAFTLMANGQTYKGGVQSDGVFHFSAQGTAGYVLRKPTAPDVWQCSGSLAAGKPPELALGAQFCAAFNRGVAENTNQWLTSTAYYKGSHANDYARYLHSVSLKQLGYAFAYDDVNNQSSVIILPNSAPPSKVTLTVKW